MAKILALFAGLILLIFSCSSNYEGTLEPHRQVNAGVYIQYISGVSPTNTTDAPTFNVKLVNDTAASHRVSLICNMDYLVGSSNQEEVITTLGPRQWKRIYFSGRRTNYRMTATCSLDRYPE